MSDWLLNLPVLWMALIIFTVNYLVTAAIHWMITRLAVGERAVAFKAMSPGMLPSLGIIFGLLVGFIASQVWSDFDKAKLAVANEASALRTAMLLGQRLSPEDDAKLRDLVLNHVSAAVSEEWPAMSSRQATLVSLQSHLSDALKMTLAILPSDEGQQTAQHEIVTSLETALEARRQRIIISQSTVSSVKWAGLLLQALCTLLAIALAHSDNRLTNAIALGLFSTGVAVSIVLIASYSRPFTGEISVGPELLKQVMTTGH